MINASEAIKKAAAFMKNYVDSFDERNNVKKYGALGDAKTDDTQAFLDALNQSKPTPVNENYLKITDEITKNLENVFNGKKQASEVVDQKFVEKLQKHCN